MSGNPITLFDPITSTPAPKAGAIGGVSETSPNGFATILAVYRTQGNAAVPKAAAAVPRAPVPGKAIPGAAIREAAIPGAVPVDPTAPTAEPGTAIPSGAAVAVIQSTLMAVSADPAAPSPSGSVHRSQPAGAGKTQTAAGQTAAGQIATGLPIQSNAIDTLGLSAEGLATADPCFAGAADPPVATGPLDPAATTAALASPGTGGPVAAPHASPAGGPALAGRLAAGASSEVAAQGKAGAQPPVQPPSATTDSASSLPQTASAATAHLQRRNAVAIGPDRTDPAGTAPVAQDSSQAITQPGSFGAPATIPVPSTVTVAGSVPTSPIPAGSRPTATPKSRQGTPREQTQTDLTTSGTAATSPGPDAIAAAGALVPSVGSAGANPVAWSGHGGDASASLGAPASVTDRHQSAASQVGTPQNGTSPARSPLASTPLVGTPQADAGGAVIGAPTDPSQVPALTLASLPAATDMAVQALTASAAPPAPSAAAAASPPPIPLGAAGTPLGTPLGTHPAPASQVAPALLNLATSATGTQRMTLRLEPADLGTVQVRIDRPVEAPAHVEVTASRLETLSLLVRDQAQLQHTLDQAGVPSEGRTLSFHLSGQDADSLSRHASGFDQSSGNDRSTPNGAAPNGSKRGAAAPDDSDPGNAASMPPPNPMRWQRIGIDITA